MLKLDDRMEVRFYEHTLGKWHQSWRTGDFSCCP